MSLLEQLEQLANQPDDAPISNKVLLKCMILMQKDISSRLGRIEDKISEFDQMKLDLTIIQTELSETKEQIAELREVEEPFPANLTVLVSGLPVSETENEESLQGDIGNLFSDGLELPDVSIRSVSRIAPRTYAEAAAGENEDAPAVARPGLVKVRLGTLDEKKRVLHSKQKLKSKGAYHRVYVRNSEDHASRLNRLNMNTLIDHLKMRDTQSLRQCLRTNHPEGRDGR